MKTYSMADVSILAIFAQCGARPMRKENEEELLASLSCDEMRDLARDIMSGNCDNPEAKAFIDWANSLSK